MRNIAVERPSIAKWAGGIYLGQQFRKDTLQRNGNKI
jgi:hypothetical protein